MRQAIVTGYDWLTGRAYVTIPGGPANIPCVMLNRIPGPRSLVWIDREDTSMPIVLGVEGPTSWILHDHFTYVDLVAGITNNGKYGGDTSWWAKVGTGATGAIQGSGVNGTGDTLSKIGQILLSSGNVAGQYATLQKDPVGDSAPNAATWLSARISLPGLTNIDAELGFSDATLAAVFGAPAAGFRNVSIAFDSTISATNWQLRVGTDGNQAYTDTGIAAVANKFIDVDLMYVPSYWAGLWIDGALVASTTTNVPPPNVTTPVNFRVYPRAGSAVSVIVDVIHVETIGTVSLP